MPRKRIPIACTLSVSDASRQATEWIDLQKRATSSESLPDGAALTFPEALADRVEDLASREAACCAFLTINTTRERGLVRVEVTSEDPDARPVITMLTGVGMR